MGKKRDLMLTPFKQALPMIKMFAIPRAVREGRIKKHLDEIWQGKSVIRRDYDWIPLYFVYRQAGEPDTVDDRTWSDLEMEELFARIDRTTSVVGRQYLYAILRIYDNGNSDSEKLRRTALYSLFRTDADFREKIQRALYPLRRDSSAYLTTLLYEELPSKPKLHYLIYLSSGLFFLCLALIALNPVFVFAAAGMALCNLLINTFYGRKMFQHYADLASLTTMLSAVGNFARIKSPAKISELDTLRELKTLAAGLNKKVFWLCLDETQAGDLAAAGIAFLNHFGLSRLIAFLRVVDDLKKSREQFRRIFDAIGSLDAHVAIASWIQSLPMSTIPAFNSTGTIDVTGMYHPLIKGAVGNSLFLQKESALITGSNMAGKTTFIKTIGLNVVLARTLFVCLAERANLPRLIVRSSIKLDEKVIDGNSYYSREIEQIRDFLNCPENRFLFLIDEIFRGTNTIERIAIGAATLRYLSHRNMVLVTTHDVELQPMLSDCSRLFHFSEQVDGNRYYFDYILRDGPCRAGNAIKLVELRGFPPGIVEEARRLAAKQGQRGKGVEG
jgi:hypothetical protein